MQALSSYRAVLGGQPLLRSSHIVYRYAHGCGFCLQAVMGVTSSGCKAWRPLNMALKRDGAGAFLSVVAVVVYLQPPTFRVTCSEALAVTCKQSNQVSLQSFITEAPEVRPSPGSGALPPEQCKTLQARSAGAGSLLQYGVPTQQFKQFQAECTQFK